MSIFQRRRLVLLGAGVLGSLPLATVLFIIQDTERDELSERTRLQEGVARIGGRLRWVRDADRGNEGWAVTFPFDWAGKTVDLNQLHQIPELIGILSETPRFDDIAVETISSITTIQEIHIRNAELTCVSFENLSKLAGLRTINLQWSSFTDSDFGCLSQSNLLEELELSGSTMRTDELSSYLIRFPNLKRLGLGNRSLEVGRITDISGKNIAQLKKLEYIELQRNPITDNFVRELSLENIIEEMNFRETLISDESVADLSKFRRLRVIDIRRSQIGDVAAKSIFEALKKNNGNVSEIEVLYGDLF